MAKELSPKAADEAQERLQLEPGFLPWLKRRFLALQPRTRRRWTLYAVLFIVAVFALFAWCSATTYDATVLVTEEGSGIGLSPYTDRVDFGDLPQGGGATIPLTLENNSRLPTRFFVVATGDIRQFIRMNDAFFLLDSGDTKVVEFSVGIPITAAPQRYTGKVYIFKIPWSPWP